MREIKFRAWNPKTKTMLLDVECRFCLSLIILQQEEYKGYVLMQYTGLKDKNGQEVYESDIVKQIGNNGVVERTFEVKYERIGFNLPKDENKSWGMGEPPTYVKFEYEIIGNIYENPEAIGK